METKMNVILRRIYMKGVPMEEKKWSCCLAMLGQLKKVKQVMYISVEVTLLERIT